MKFFKLLLIVAPLFDMSVKLRQIIMGGCFAIITVALFLSFSSALASDHPLNFEHVNLNVLAISEAEQHSAKGERCQREISQFLEVLGEIESLAPKLDPSEVWQLTRIVIEQSKFFGNDPLLTLSIIKIESNFDRYAVSSANAHGLMQLLPSTARAMAYELEMPFNGVSDLYDMENNIRLGLYYFRKLMLKYNSKRVALAAYNFGPGYVDRMLRTGGPVPRRYARLVLGVYSRLNEV